MPSKTMKLFTVTLIAKGAQFSKSTRVEETDLEMGVAPYVTTLVQARSLDEVEDIIAEHDNTYARYIVTELGNGPSLYIRKGNVVEVEKA